MPAPKTHCPKGHEYTPENSMPHRNYKRCRKCKSDFNLRYRVRKGQPFTMSIREKSDNLEGPAPKKLRAVKAPLPPRQNGNLTGAKRPVIATPSELTRAANTWAGAYLPGYSLPELEKALGILKRHPAQASPGYSKAKSARQRVEMEINRQRAQHQ
jgi:hypothetical protein